MRSGSALRRAFEEFLGLQQIGETQMAEDFEVFVLPVHDQNSVCPRAFKAWMRLLPINPARRLRSTWL